MSLMAPPLHGRGSPPPPQARQRRRGIINDETNIFASGAAETESTHIQLQQREKHHADQFNDTFAAGVGLESRPQTHTGTHADVDVGPGVRAVDLARGAHFVADQDKEGQERCNETQTLLRNESGDMVPDVVPTSPPITEAEVATGGNAALTLHSDNDAVADHADAESGCTDESHMISRQFGEAVCSVLNGCSHRPFDVVADALLSIHPSSAELTNLSEDQRTSMLVMVRPALKNRWLAGEGVGDVRVHANVQSIMASHLWLPKPKFFHRKLFIRPLKDKAILTILLFVVGLSCIFPLWFQLNRLQQTVDSLQRADCTLRPKSIVVNSGHTCVFNERYWCYTVFYDEIVTIQAETTVATTISNAKTPTKGQADAIMQVAAAEPFVWVTRHECAVESHVHGHMHGAPQACIYGIKQKRICYVGISDTDPTANISQDLSQDGIVVVAGHPVYVTDNNDYQSFRNFSQLSLAFWLVGVAPFGLGLILLTVAVAHVESRMRSFRADWRSQTSGVVTPPRSDLQAARARLNERRQYSIVISLINREKKQNKGGSSERMLMPHAASSSLIGRGLRRASNAFVSGFQAVSRGSFNNARQTGLLHTMRRRSSAHGNDKSDRNRVMTDVGDDVGDDTVDGGGGERQSTASAPMIVGASVGVGVGVSVDGATNMLALDSRARTRSRSKASLFGTVEANSSAISSNTAVDRQVKHVDRTRGGGGGGGGGDIGIQDPQSLRPGQDLDQNGSNGYHNGESVNKLEDESHRRDGALVSTRTLETSDGRASDEDPLAQTYKTSPTRRRSSKKRASIVWADDLVDLPNASFQTKDNPIDATAKSGSNVMSSALSSSSMPHINESNERDGDQETACNVVETSDIC